MGTVIAVNGKGGTGKTTVSALIVRHIASNNRGSLLAVDADPNATLADALGIRIEQTMVGVIEETSSKKEAIPAGMTKDRFIEMRIQESIVEGEHFDFLAMGRPEGPGCYCYVNTVLRNILGRVLKLYDYLVIDNAAGMEHISRRTERTIDNLILVSDFSAVGVRSSKRIWDLAREIGIRIGKVYLVVNKVSGPLDTLKGEIERAGIPLAGTIEFDKDLMTLSLEARPVSELKGTATEESISRIMQKVLMA